MVKLTFPFTEEKIRAVKVGDGVLISGVVFTGSDAARTEATQGGVIWTLSTLVSSSPVFHSV